MAHDDVVVSHCCVLDRRILDSVNMTDPRRFSLKRGARRLLALTSLSWLLPMERTPAIFTTGVADAGDEYIVASGEADLACRFTHVAKALFA